MALSDKLYLLRKQNGLSQEQLAEKLDVSRQSISKWESGYSMPESDKLIAISTYFKVSLDYLMKEEITQLDDKVLKISKDSLHVEKRYNRFIGIFLLIGGMICLVIWGLLFIFNSSASNRISDSSMIIIDGNGAFLIFCIAVISIGAFFLLKYTKK